MSDVGLNVKTFPVLDTGLGQSLGYKDDADFLLAAQKEREELPLAVQKMLERADEDLERRVLWGDQA